MLQYGDAQLSDRRNTDAVLLALCLDWFVFHNWWEPTERGGQYTCQRVQYCIRPIVSVIFYSRLFNFWSWQFIYILADETNIMYNFSTMIQSY